MAEHLSPTNASMLAIEDPDHGIHIQIIYVFEGTPPTAQEFRETVAQRLLGAPRFRQRIAWVPLNLGRPAWVDDERFDLDYHLRRTALPAPSGEDELRALSNRLLEQQLDLRRPLWEMWLVEGLAHDRFAVIHRVHHAMVDGVATQEISGMMFSSTPEEDRRHRGMDAGQVAVAGWPAGFRPDRPGRPLGSGGDGFAARIAGSGEPVQRCGGEREDAGNPHRDLRRRSADDPQPPGRAPTSYGLGAGADGRPARDQERIRYDAQ